MPTKGLTNNQLKIIALLTMTCDHVGKELLPQYPILQIIGRLAFPIFAFMIAEGCVYTKNKLKYFVSVTLLGLLCQVVYFVAMGSLYQCVLITFSLSIGLIFAMEYARKKKTVLSKILVMAVFFLALFICEIMPDMLSWTDFEIDYGILGVLLPVIIYLGPNQWAKIVGTTVMLVMLALFLGNVQWYGLLAVPFLIVYNSKRGKWKLKHLFYIYYPMHLVVIYGIGMLLG